MKIFAVISTILAAVCCFSFSLQHKKEYTSLYSNSLAEFKGQLTLLSNTIRSTDISTEQGRQKIREQIRSSRLKMKGLDFWFRYFEPNVYRKINGPLPVEWKMKCLKNLNRLTKEKAPVLH
ncbi:MAG: hypothetical protein WDO16_20175 [Bacteroidota bacterium]